MKFNSIDRTTANYIQDKIELLIIYSCSIIAGSAISEAFKEAINLIWPDNKRANFFAKMIYAIMMMIILIAIIIAISSIDKNKTIFT